MPDDTFIVDAKAPKPQADISAQRHFSLNRPGRYFDPVALKGLRCVSVAPELIQMTARHLHVDKLCFKLSKYFLLSNFNKKQAQCRAAAES